eukprot:CAMPEP_0171594716 /NCGR_PEP_ID=MMETSP0990-20121206/866_1 /TAXON_ID=483369 /ORGANISM="non described non described, Strain CCMP2098" /LENGTH=173 /DNA_ID=CAMNT_0012155481 /DNA_START=67 /DNA_END=588 /DNA_ORIENTATION=-
MLKSTEKSNDPTEIDPDSLLDSAVQKHMTIPELLREYGLIALLFHFTVWSSCLTIVFSLLSAGVDLSHLPAFLSFLSPTSSSGEDLSTVVLSNSDIASTSAKAILMGRLGATIAIVEVVGPLRIALTVAVTPPLSNFARKFAMVRSAEATVGNWVAETKKVAGNLLPTSRTDE